MIEKLKQTAFNFYIQIYIYNSSMTSIFTWYY